MVVTDNKELSSAVEAMKLGAFDYMVKPVEKIRLITNIERAIEMHTMVHKIDRLRGEMQKTYVYKNIVGQSEAIRHVFAQIEEVAEININVFIQGESGTGKELVAKAVHYSSSYKTGPFIAINCGAIPESLQESEFFGHEKGSFTGAFTRMSGKFEEAEGGTLFLDEIGDMPYEAQTRLLRVIQEGEFNRVGGHEKIKTNVRIMTATHRNIDELVEKGQFREDLFYRLNVFPISIPPLRLRLSDLNKLVDYFLKKSFKEGLDQKSITEEAMNELKKYKWPGNIRELENFIRRLVVLIPSNKITGNDIIKNISKTNNTFISDSKTNNDQNKISLSMSVEEHLKKFFKLHKDKLPSSGLYTRIINEVERPLISICLNATKGNQIRASKLLGLNRNTLRKKIKELKIKVL